jgi:hypothetical protein
MEHEVTHAQETTTAPGSFVASLLAQGKRDEEVVDVLVERGTKARMHRRELSTNGTSGRYAPQGGAQC